MGQTPVRTHGHHRGRLTRAGTVTTVTDLNRPWHTARLVAVDLEGSGAQDRDQEQILEIAAIRLRDGRPDLATAYCTCIDPQRPIPPARWISPGLAGTALHGQPTLEAVRGDLLTRLTGTYLVGHNIRVDWRLLHRHLPDLTIAGLIDTHRLAKTTGVPGRLGLTDLLDQFNLTAQVTAAAPDSQPHRALWDTTGAAILLITLINRRFTTPPTLTRLLDAAAVPTETAATTSPCDPVPPPGAAPQATLFD